MQLFDFSEPLIVYTLLGGFIVFYGLVSLVIKERLYISESLIATIMGLILGPACLRLIDPTVWGYKNAITEELTRIVLAIQIMTAAINLPRAYITRQFRSMIIMLLPVMSWMWISSAAIIYFFIPDVTFVETLLIASCITPTDPILANSVVQGSFAEKHIPPNVRHLLSAESGVNDGMGFPFLFFALFLLESPKITATAVFQWFSFVWGYHILLSIAIGIMIGWAARKLLGLAESREWIDKESFLVFAFALAIFVVGGVSIIGSDALLACFFAGTSFSWDDWFRDETHDAHLQDVIDLLLNLTIFMYIGMILPWRLPIVVLFKGFIPAFHTFKEAAFAGYFGPIGIGAIFLAMTVEKEIGLRLGGELTDIDEESMLHVQKITFPIVTFVVLSSVIVHGITVPILNIGSRIDMERFPSIASISSQVARLPVIDFVESLTLERDNKGRVRKKEKMKAEFAPKSSEELYQDVHNSVMEEEQSEGNGVYTHNHIETDVLIDSSGDEQSNQDNVNSVDYHWLQSSECSSNAQCVRRP